VTRAAHEPSRIGRLAERIPRAPRAALERVLPVAAGAIVGAGAAWWAPTAAEETFFELAAQIIPVVLLALVIEARAIGIPFMRAPQNALVATWIEWARRSLEGLIVVALLVAEWYALDVVSDSPSGPADPKLVWLGLAWGFVTVAVLAVFGTRRPRVTVDIEAEWHDRGAIVEIAFGNEYGDKSVVPLMNVLVPLGRGMQSWVKNADGPEQVETMTVEEVLENVPAWTCRSTNIELTAGDTKHARYLVETDPGETSFWVIVRADHHELRNGRVERRRLVSV
jgi:hypothetical protein